MKPPKKTSSISVGRANKGAYEIAAAAEARTAKRKLKTTPGTDMGVETDAAWKLALKKKKALALKMSKARG